MQGDCCRTCGHGPVAMPAARPPGLTATASATAAAATATAAAAAASASATANTSAAASATAAPAAAASGRTLGLRAAQRAAVMSCACVRRPLLLTVAAGHVGPTRKRGCGVEHVRQHVRGRGPATTPSLPRHHARMQGPAPLPWPGLLPAPLACHQLPSPSLLSSPGLHVVWVMGYVVWVMALCVMWCGLWGRWYG